MAARKKITIGATQRRKKPLQTPNVDARTRFNSADFVVTWNAARKRYEVHGDDGRCHLHSTDKDRMVKAAIRKASRAAKLGMSSAVRVEQGDGSFKVEWES